MQESEKDLQTNTVAEGETLSDGDLSEIGSDAMDMPSQELTHEEMSDTDCTTENGTDTPIEPEEPPIQPIGDAVSTQPLTEVVRTGGFLMIPKVAIITVAVLIPLVIAMSVGVGIWYANWKEDPWKVESGLVDYGGFSAETGSSDQIVIPGYGEILLDADTRDVMLILPNPSGNPCYFRFSILLAESGEVLYTSGLVPPGKAIENLRLKRALSEGNYPAVIQIETFSLDETHTPMNGANVETVLNLR